MTADPDAPLAPIPEKKRRAVVRGVAARLFLAFCGVTLMTVLVALVGDRALRNSRRTLRDTRESFDSVSGLLDNATRSLDNANATITSANTTMDNTVATMKATGNRVRNINTIDLPAVIAIGAIREALTTVAVGERTLLMRQLHDLEIRKRQRSAINDAFRRAYQSIDSFSAIEPRLSVDKRAAWLDFLNSWESWAKTHGQLMRELDEIDSLLRKDVRDGPEFDAASTRAFDLAFGPGQTERDAVSRKLDDVVSLISSSARDFAAIAFADTQAATADAITAMEGMSDATGQLSRFKHQLNAVNQRARDTTLAAAAAIEDSGKARWWFIACSLLGFVVSVVLALRQTRNLSRPIRAAAEQMRLLAEGRIDQDIMAGFVGRSDEIGALARSVGDMLHAQREEVDIARDMAAGDFSRSVALRGDNDQLGISLSEMMRITRDALFRVNRHVQQVTSDAQGISTVSQSLSQGAERTARALVDIAGHTTLVGEQTHRNAQNASRANEFAISSRQVAERGYAAVEEMVASMKDIQTSSAKIATIVKLIDDIAFQTNLLALNAAVEAARAGRQGKGFSVVAEEVRNLASRSAKAARDTAVLVEETVRRVENGSVIAMRTDAAFREILENGQKTADLYGEIAAASQEQSKNIDQIVTGLAGIDASTRENSQYAQDTAEAARTLSRQSGELRRMMSRFQLRDDAPRLGYEPLTGDGEE